MNGRVTLYHGTSAENAESLLSRGFSPEGWRRGPNCGRRGHLYLTSDPENAAWYAERFDNGVVLAFEVAVEDLIVDPEDGVFDTVAEEIAGELPALLVTTAPVSAEHVSRHEPEMGPRPG